MRRTYILFLSGLMFPCLLQSQSFTDRRDMLADRDFHSAVPIAIADMNGDGLDDIVSMNKGTVLNIQYQTPDPSRPFVRYKAPVNIDLGEQNDIIIADFNNDGANDIFTVGSYDRIKMLYAVPNSYEFNLVYNTVTPFFSQGASAGDFNGDGWLDVVMLNDNGANYSMMNDGTGNLVREDFFDFATVPPSDNSGNYGSVYTDFDMDGDNDFYIAKCRQGVNNPNDPRRINALFVNDGTNHYTQDASSYGLAVGHQTWTADFGDMDNDGDLDCFMTQHNTVCELYENIDNDTFINITLSSGLNIGGVPLQGMFRDLDNDGFQDILVSGDRVDYYHNNGDKTFTRQEPFGAQIFGTFSLGDLNNDGFTDVYASTVIPFNNPDLQKEDILFMNEVNDNHFLGLTLMDINKRTAVGAVASLYGDWGIQVRDVRGGEQYGVSNSHGIIFGLGDETSFDSLVVRWPDGSRETYTNLDVDQTWRIDQLGCQNIGAKIFDELAVLCNEDSLVLHVGIHGGVQWSTGETTDSIVIKEAGLYFVTYLDDEACLTISLPIEVIKDPDSVAPVITYEGNNLLC
ncbi:MAG: CRTAC1 family protein, partial [Bacteroidota bacterium]|nr:CRTAC1 family protein [Bacteroidota bacterium]